MAEKVYPKGIRVFKPRDGAPEWVLGTVLVTPHELTAWIAENAQYMGEYQGNPQLKLQLLKGKDGPYITVDTFKPEPKQSQADIDQAKQDAEESTGGQVGGLPF